MMMKKLIILLFISTLTIGKSSAQNDNTACDYPLFFCDSTVFYSHHIPNGVLCPAVYFHYWFRVGTPITALSISSNVTINSYSLYGPFVAPQDPVCGAYSGTPVSTGGPGPAFSASNGGSLAAGYYYLKVSLSNCSGALTLEPVGGNLDCEPLPCENCVGSFAPEQGKTYVVSCWVKEVNAAQSTTTYTKPQLTIEYNGSTYVKGPLTASGQIIDGWQRLEDTIKIPAGATAIKVKFSCTSGDCLFDDLRIHPFDGSMKTYVYDPVTLWLVAELDERNYATFYEYDEEGKLIRIKKETEKGIMTIQESKTGIRKD
jgi:hypothetical protein